MENIAIVGGTNGIGRAVADLHAKRGDRVTIIGRETQGIPQSDRFRAITADLSLAAGQDKVLTTLAGEAFDRLVFTAGVLTAKPGVTSEGKDAAFMVNHVGRARLTDALSEAMPTNAKVGFLSAWGGYKKPPASDYVYGEPGRNGLKHVMNGYVINDAWFAEFVAKNPSFAVTGFFPGPSKGTKLMDRGHTPFPFNVMKLLFPLIARPVEDVAQDFVTCMDEAKPGIAWFNSGKPMPRPGHLTEPANATFTNARTA